MADPNAKLDPAIQKGLIEFIEHRLGLFGALKFKHSVEGCTCVPCETILAIIDEADIPEPPEPAAQ
jgi:hypothetical protein